MRQVLATAEKFAGADHPFTATSINNLANLLMAEGRYGDADPPLREDPASLRPEIDAQVEQSVAFSGRLPEQLRVCKTHRRPLSPNAVVPTAAFRELHGKRTGSALGGDVSGAFELKVRGVGLGDHGRRHMAHGLAADVGRPHYARLTPPQRMPSMREDRERDR
jgi:hypothetical protein